MAQARVINPCSTCGVGVPPTPSGSATSADRRAWANSQITRAPNPGPDEIALHERSRASVLWAREALANRAYQQPSGNQLQAPTPQWHPYSASLPPTRKGNRTAFTRQSRLQSNPGLGLGIAVGALGATALAGYQALEYKKRCKVREGETLKAHGSLGDLHRYVYDRGCGQSLPYEVVVTKGELQYGPDGTTILNSKWYRSRYSTFAEASTALPLEDFLPTTPSSNPQTSSTVLAPGFRVW